MYWRGVLWDSRRAEGGGRTNCSVMGVEFVFVRLFSAFSLATQSSR